jgi:hypothetical protein
MPLRRGALRRTAHGRRGMSTAAVTTALAALAVLPLTCLLFLMSLLRDGGNRCRKQQAERNSQWRCECFHDPPPRANTALMI